VNKIQEDSKVSRNYSKDAYNNRETHENCFCFRLSHSNLNTNVVCNIHEFEACLVYIIISVYKELEFL
jgi:hypothetical protein